VSTDASPSLQVSATQGLNEISTSLLMIDPNAVELEPEIIPAEWILSGQPKSRCKKVARSRDWASHIVVWECSAGSFKWHFSMDETILVLAGEAFMLQENGEERRFGKGDLGFFPAGTSCTWRIDSHFMKVGVLREPLWRPFGLLLKGWRRLLQALGLAEKSPLPA
jgi:uncharacterized protein